jgi:nickel-dependent lactate racemase
MRVVMKYGRDGLTLDLPDDLDVAVIRKRVMPVLKDPEAILKSALANPVCCKSLIEEARDCRSACILICDITRPVPNGIVLPVLVKELIRAGIKPEAITILVATGLHRPNEDEELRELVGSDWVLDAVPVVNHFARNEEDHESLGTLPGNIPVKLDRRFVFADLRIVVGLVEPHFMAGYSGGRKLVAPGVAHEDTIRVLHSAGILEHCQVANCILDGNPLHGVQMDIVKLVGRIFAINTVIDEDRQISFINFGSVEESHLDAVSFVRYYAEIPVRRRFRTVLTSAAGYPLDKTYYQTVKGMVGALDILEPGGNLIIVSECSGGVGSAEFAEAQMNLIRLGPDRFLQGLLQKRYAAIDEWQSEMLVKAMKKANIYLYSEGLTEAQRALTGIHTIASPSEAIAESVKSHHDRHVAVIPEGPYVIPVFTPDHFSTDQETI